MITNIIILLVVVAVIAGIVSLVGSSGNGVQESIDVKEKDQDYVPVDTTEQLEDSFGTLSDRAVAALQYQRLEDSFNRNCADADIDDAVKHNFRKMAVQLTTIGTKVDPKEVESMVHGDGTLPPGWELTNKT